MIRKWVYIVFLLFCLPAASCGWFSSSPITPEDGEEEEEEDGDSDIDTDIISDSDFDIESIDDADIDIPDFLEVELGCTDSVECQDGNLCNGEEYCDPVTHMCMEGAMPDDGTLCLVDPRSICIAGECMESVCGDCFTDRGAGEFCDDCNDDPGDGCHVCQITCSADEDCDDGDICNGDETCDTGSGTCENGTPIADGTVCGSDPRKICLSGLCVTSICGDGYLDVDGGEECEGELTQSCTTSCSTTGTEHCVLCVWSECLPPSETCNGADDDCDGVCDNGFDCCAGETDNDCTTCGGSGVGGGTRTCSDTCGWSTCCSAEDYCNGCDDDCNGVIDEHVRLSREIRITDDPDNAGWPSVAFNTVSSEFAIAFHDNRINPGVLGNYEIFFCRLDDRGTKLTPDIRISNANYTSIRSSLVYTGTEYGVAWYDTRIDPFPPSNSEIYFTRIDNSGSPTGPEIRLTNAPDSSSYPSLVFTGSEFALAWDDERNGVDEEEIYFAKLDLTGTKTTSDIRVTNALGVSIHTSLVFTGSRFGLAWHSDRDGNSEIYFNLVNLDGTIAGPDVRITSDINDSRRPSLAYNGSEFAVTWCDDRDGSWGVYFAKISESGAKIGSDIRISDSAISATEKCKTDLVWNASNSEYGLMWHDDRDGNLEVYFARLSTDGTIIGSELRISEAVGDSEEPSLVWSGSQWGAAWRDHRFDPENSEIYFARIGCIPVP